MTPEEMTLIRQFRELKSSIAFAFNCHKGDKTTLFLDSESLSVLKRGSGRHHLPRWMNMVIKDVGPSLTAVVRIE